MSAAIARRESVPTIWSAYLILNFITFCPYDFIRYHAGIENVPVAVKGFYKVSIVANVNQCMFFIIPFLVRLACVKHAASVRSEPESNSNVLILFFSNLDVDYD